MSAGGVYTKEVIVALVVKTLILKLVRKVQHLVLQLKILAKLLKRT